MKTLMVVVFAVLVFGASEKTKPVWIEVESDEATAKPEEQSHVQQAARDEAGATEETTGFEFEDVGGDSSGTTDRSGIIRRILARKIKTIQRLIEKLKSLKDRIHARIRK
uniref:Uncharacterized protein n=1 Tax=Lygus hesperus TaxID=30085 RepID=A0A0K8SV15_LYGHE